MKLTTIIGVNVNDLPNRDAKGNAPAENKYRLIHNEADNTVSNASSVDSFSNIFFIINCFLVCFFDSIFFLTLNYNLLIFQFFACPIFIAVLANYKGYKQQLFGGLAQFVAALYSFRI